MVFVLIYFEAAVLGEHLLSAFLHLCKVIAIHSSFTENNVLICCSFPRMLNVKKLRINGPGNGRFVYSEVIL